MHSIEMYEDYKLAEYWMELVRRYGFKNVVHKIVRHYMDVPIDVLRDLVKDIAEMWRWMSVEERFIEEILKLPEYAENAASNDQM